MGKCYHSSESESNPSTLYPVEEKASSFEGLRSDIQSRFLMTYRKDFPMILGSYYTSDMGWGCMHRSGQMLLSQAFIFHYLGRDWRKCDDPPKKYFDILQLFGDRLQSPYSIHRIALHGGGHEKCVGEWYGPSTLSHVIKKLVSRYHGDEFAVYVSDDNIVYKNDVEAMCSKDGEWRKAAIILLTSRLGLGTISESFFNAIRDTFHFPQSLGILGGKPRSSLYFIGYQDSLLFYLDPHVNIPAAVDMSDIPFDTSTYHTDVIRNMKMADIDPSIGLGFYCRNRKDFDDFCSRVEKLNGSDIQLIAVQESRPSYSTPTSCDWPEEEDEILQKSVSEDDFLML